MAVTIGMHAERVAGDERAARWVVPAGSLPTGRVRRAPGRLGEMLRDTTLTEALVENSAVWLWLRGDLTWARLGAVVQSALREALTEPAGWSVEPAPGEVLAHVTADLLAGSAGDFIRSHGGWATSEPVGDGSVAVRLGGVCEHCPAAASTLRLRLLGELRRRCPGVREVAGGHGELTVALDPEPTRTPT